jgi:hypothetical protein
VRRFAVLNWVAAPDHLSTAASIDLAMSRNLYILAATLLLFSLISCAMVGSVSSTQPNLPGNGSLWKTTSLFLFLGAVVAAFAGVMTAMFEQVERRNEERERREGRRGH